MVLQMTLKSHGPHYFQGKLFSSGSHDLPYFSFNFGMNIIFFKAVIQAVMLSYIHVKCIYQS